MKNRSKKAQRHKSLLVLSLIFLGMISFSCANKDTHYHIYEIEDAKWGQNNALLFSVDSSMFRTDSLLFQTGIPYTLSIEVTNNVHYPYRNIWFFVRDNIASDTAYTEQSKEFQMADIEGRWLGSGFGNLFQSSFVVADNIIFDERRNYYIRIRHGMRDEPLIGIEKIGIKLSKKKS